MARPEAPTSRRVWLALMAAAVATCGLAGGGLLLAARRVTTLLVDPGWTADAIPASQVPATFGVRFAGPPRQYRSRQSGFQDPFLEAVALLPAGGEAAFLGLNGLAPGEPPASDTSEAEDQVRALEPGAGELQVVGLDGLRPLLSADGGFVALYRWGALLRAGDATWVYLVASGT